MGSPQRLSTLESSPRLVCREATTLAWKRLPKPAALILHEGLPLAPAGRTLGNFLMGILLSNGHWVLPDHLGLLGPVFLLPWWSCLALHDPGKNRGADQGTQAGGAEDRGGLTGT